MARSKNSVKNGNPRRQGGPYIAAAFFCESIIEDRRDGTLSAIRIIDQISVVASSAAPSNAASAAQAVTVPVSGMVAFKTGDARGSIQSD